MAGDSALTAEIDEGPSGPEIAAFFGLDGTLIIGYSAMVLAGDRLMKGELDLARVRRVARAGVDLGLRRTDVFGFIGEGWKGFREDELEEMGERLFVKNLARRIHPEARKLVAAHQKKEHTVALATAATRYQAEPVARHLGIEHVLCTRLAIENGVATGEVLEPKMYGPPKAETVTKFAADHGIDLGLSYAYADGDEDVPLLESVGNPRPTNPARGLARVAEERGWPTRRFGAARRPGPADVARTAAAYLSTYPLALASLGVGLARRSVEPAVDLALAIGPELMLATGGIEVNATGKEHLWSHRPAVFIWNHVNNLDGYIVSSLVRRDFTTVAKAELGRGPLGAIGRRVGVVFIDRTDSAKAVAALEPVVDAIRHGKSVVIAPEGTRTPGRIGPFKKGAFRMAMACHVPIVPIVIRNAVDVMPGSGVVMRPGIVDVRVLPPIPVDDWTLENLDERIAGVRSRFVDTLEDWPED